MASSKAYLAFVLDQLSSLQGISHRGMMGEYILYYQGKIIGGIYDDRFLVKSTEASRRLLGDAPLVRPYEGAKEMLFVTDIDDRDLLRELVCALGADLPAPSPHCPSTRR